MTAAGLVFATNFAGSVTRKTFWSSNPMLAESAAKFAFSESTTWSL